MPQTFIARDQYDAPIQALKPGSAQVVSLNTTSAASAALASDTRVVRLVASADCFVALGTGTPAATTTGGLFLPAGVPEYFRCDAAAAVKVAGIVASGTGTLYVAEMN